MNIQTAFFDDADFIMEKTYVLTDKQALDVKVWPILMILCGLFIIWICEGTVGSIVLAILASGVSWWLTQKTPLSITFRENGDIEFKFLSKKTEISVQDIRAIIEDNYYKEIKVLHTNGMIVIKREMPNILDFIKTVQKYNPAVQLDLKHTWHK